MERYSDYKQSCIQWLDKIPSHWDVVKLKVYCKENKLKNKDNGEFNVLSLSYGNVIAKKDLNSGLLPENYNNYQIVSPGNIILRLTDLQNDHKSLRTGLVKEHGIITSAYVGLIVSGIVPSYIRYLLHTYDILKVFYSMGGGLRQSMSYKDVANLLVCVPPLEEQKAIVDYINNKNNKVDSLISELNSEIDYLKELKQSEIADAVTKGLNPTVAMKESHNPFMGRIPAHWEERKIKYCFVERSEKNHPEEQMLCATQSQGVIPQSLYNNRVVVVNKGFENLKFVSVGDFVISLRSFEGGIEYAYYQGIISAAYTILTPLETEHADYFRILFKSSPFIQLLQTCVTGIREGQNINYSLLSRKFIPVPPIEEQKEIVNFIENKNAKIKSLIEELESEINFLKEYKQRIISDAVTGQINVQNI